MLTAAVLAVVSCKSSDPGDGADGGDEGTESADDGGPGTNAESVSQSGTASASGTSGADDADEGGVGEEQKYDVNGIPDAPGLPCSEGGGNQSNFSYIWIANSGQDTVSKINTETLEEEGRYRTDPGIGNPSRTSVSLNGNVAVADRNGGVAMFWARKSDCVDRNGNGSIETSTGGGDILDWDDEECRAWYTPFNYTSQRPVAWAPGELNPETCDYRHEKLWTSGAGGDAGAGVDVIMIDGDSGDVDEIVNIPEVAPAYYGIYGGAVDAEGNFWGSQLGIGSLVRVDRASFDYEVWPMANSGYGMTVDHLGQVWTCSYSGVGRFTYATESWDTASVMGGGGCMEDGQGVLWLASNSLVGVDIEDLSVVSTLTIPSYVHGVSVDFHGYVWGVTLFEPYAYRVDPTTGDYETFVGLTEPYTYSDMTGFALANAGGYVPAG